MNGNIKNTFSYTNQFFLGIYIKEIYKDEHVLKSVCCSCIRKTFKSNSSRFRDMPGYLLNLLTLVNFFDTFLEAAFLIHVSRNKHETFYILTLLVKVAQFTIIQWKFPFTNNTHDLAAFLCWEESIMHNTEQTSHSALAIVAKKMLVQS